MRRKWRREEKRNLDESISSFLVQDGDVSSCLDQLLRYILKQT